MQKVFVYGSLLRGLCNSHLLRTSRLLQPGARTQDSAFVLIDSGEAEGYPFAIKSQELPGAPATSLLGEVYEVTDSVLASLDKLEEHPNVYQREEIQYIGGSTCSTAWMYILHDRAKLDAIRDDVPQWDRQARYPLVQPLGDWRLYHHVARGNLEAAVAASARRSGAWPSTRRTATGTGPHAVFSFGSNGIAQLRERCKNPNLIGTPALLEDAVRVFAGASPRWQGGGVASIVPCAGMQVLGNVAWLSSEEILRLDLFERGDPSELGLSEDPYAPDGTYRRQDVVVRSCLPRLAEAGTDGASPEARSSAEPPPLATDPTSWPLLEAVAYVKVNLEWVGPPSEAYVAACRANVDMFWPGLRGLPFEVRNGNGLLMAEVEGQPHLHSAVK